MSGTALETLRLLEWRLARLEFFLGREDATNEPDAAEDSVSSRLAKLESRFADTCSKHPAAKELLRLQTRLPDIFSPERSTEPSPANQLQMVLSSASTYTACVSALNALQEYPVPDANELATLIALRSRLLKARATQDNHQRQVAELTQRSASLLSQWYQSRILDDGEQWSAWEDRLASAEQTIRRREASAAREESNP